MTMNVAVRPHKNGSMIHAMVLTEGIEARIQELRPGSLVLWGSTLCSTRARPVGRGGLRVQGLNTSVIPRTFDLFEDRVRVEYNEIRSGDFNSPERERILRMFCERCVRKAGLYIA